MKEFIDKLIERLEEISVSRDNDGVINGCNMGICEDDDCLKCMKKKMISIVNHLAEEFKVSEMPTGPEGFCEWKKGESSVFPIKTNCGNSIDVNYGYEFCPYCGKKIKDAPYTEGE